MTFDSRWKNPQGKDPEQLWRWAQELIAELRKGDFFDAAFEDNIGTGITNAQLADMAAWTIKARNNSASGDPQDVARGDLTAATEPVNTQALLGFLSTNELRRFTTGNVGGFQLLNSGTVSNAATLDIVLTSYTGYRALKLVLSSWVPETDDRELWLLFSTDGGMNFDVTGYSYAAVRNRDGSGGTVSGEQSTAATEIKLASTGASIAVSNVAAEGGLDAEITLHNQAGNRWSRVRYSSAYTSADSQTISINGAATREAQQDTDALRLMFETDDIVSGDWALYGLA
jgi:hypothetical protein